MAPLFSILVPSYNHGRYVKAALDSLVAQTYGDWEAIVVNDGSTDNTVEVIEAYARRESRVRVFHKANGGCASALNVAFRQARGEWILWLSADDTFDPEKLAAHLEGFVRHPAARFFHTHFYLKDYANGIVSAPEHWRRQPEERWQVLEMLESTYVQTISMCVHSDCLACVGAFDETLRYSQDYDMFLRLVAHCPAVFLDQRTCYIGLHPGQTTAVQGSLNLFIDDGKAAIKFLNRTPFAGLFPLMDLSDQAQANLALDHALDTAAHPYAFQYKAGAHPALLGRILEWVHDPARGVAGSRWFRMFHGYASRAIAKHAGTPLGFWWKVARAASFARRGHPAPFVPVMPSDAMRAEAGCLWGKQDARWETYAVYLKRFEGSRYSPPEHRHQTDETLFVTPEGTVLESTSLYGALRMTMTMAQSLADGGRPVAVFGQRDAPIGFFEGVPAVGAGSDWDMKRALRYWGGTANLVAIGRSDVLVSTRARRRAVYHHTTHSIPGGLSPSAMNRMGVSVLAISDYSRRQLINAGHDSTRVYRVINTYDPDVFHWGEGDRNPWRLVFAGCLAPYKGVDIALQAFRKIRAAEPRASLTLCGALFDGWGTESRANAMDAGWVGPDNRPDVARIEADLPGVRFLGYLEPSSLAELFRNHSLLLLPSRHGENFPLVAIEAQACGCLPVMPRHMALPETVREGETGFLYEPNTPGVLADTVLNLWRHGCPSATQRVAAAHWVRDTFPPSRAYEVFAVGLDTCREATPAERRRAQMKELRSRLAGTIRRTGKRLS